MSKDKFRNMFYAQLYDSSKICHKLFVQSRDKDQHVHPVTQSDQSMTGTLWVAKDPKIIHAGSKDYERPCVSCPLMSLCRFFLEPGLNYLHLIEILKSDSH